MRNHARSKIERVFDRAVDILAYTAGFAIILIILAVSLEVFSRTLFNRPILGVAEIAEYLILYMAFFGATWVQKKHAHVSMDIIVERLNKKARALTNTATSIAGGVALLVISLYAAIYAYDTAQKGVHTITPLEFPTAILVSIVAIGCFILSIQFFKDSYNAIKTVKKLKSQ